RVENGLDCQKIDISPEQRFCCIEVGLSELIKIDRAKSGIIDVGRNRSGDGQGAKRAGDETPCAGCICRTISRLSRDARRGQIDLNHEGAKIDIVDHALEKFLIFPTACRLLAKKKIMQA